MSIIRDISTFLWLLIFYIFARYAVVDLDMPVFDMEHVVWAHNELFYLTTKDVFLIVGVFLLFIEIYKAATTGDYSISETIVSFFVSIAYLVLFLMWDKAHNAVFFIAKRDELEEQNIDFKIVKENFLNYRLLSGKVIIKKQVVPSYILFYSYLERKNGGRIEFIQNGVYHLNRMQIKFITLEKFNELLNKNYKNIYEIYKNPPTIEEEIRIREKLLETKYNLTPLIVLEEIPLDKRIDVEIDSKVYPDNKEVIKF
jgi:hypothetical protein